MKVRSPCSSGEFDVPESKDFPSKRYSKLRIIKNVVVLGAGVLLLFTAYDGLAMLQSTTNRQQGIGVISQAVCYIFFSISAVLFPKYIIKKLGSKSTFAFSMLTYLPYVASNFYTHWALMIPTSILIGLGAALLWGSQANYLNDISVMYSELIIDSRERTMSENDGIVKNSLTRNAKVASSKTRMTRSLSCDPNCFVIYNNNNAVLKSYKSIDTKRCSISIAESPLTPYFETDNKRQQCIDGGVSQEKKEMNYGSFRSTKIPSRTENISSLTEDEEFSKRQERESIRRTVIESTTARFFGFHGVAVFSSHITSNLMTYYILQSEVLEGKSNSSCICGADYCNVESICFEENIVEPSYQMRYILTAACVGIGIVSVLIVFLFLDQLETEKENVSYTMDLLMATYKLGKRKKLLLLIPFSLYLGMVQGFFTGDFNKSFIGCAWGTYHVGLVALSYGAVSGVSSLSSGWLVKRLGRIPIILTATVVNLGANIFLLSWSPSSDEPHWFFVAAGLWGVFVGAIWSQLRAFYGVLFKADEEAAFAAFHVWYSMGFTLSFGYSNYICTSVKIYILITVCILGFIGYLSVEIMHLKNKTKH